MAEYALGMFTGEFQSIIPDIETSRAYKTDELSAKRNLDVLVSGKPQKLTLHRFVLTKKVDDCELSFEITPVFEKFIKRKIEISVYSNQIGVYVSTAVEGGVSMIFQYSELNRIEKHWLDRLENNVKAINLGADFSESGVFTFGRDALVNV